MGLCPMNLRVSVSTRGNIFLRIFLKNSKTTKAQKRKQQKRTKTEQKRTAAAVRLMFITDKLFQ